MSISYSNNSCISDSRKVRRIGSYKGCGISEGGYGSKKEPPHTPLEVFLP